MNTSHTGQSMATKVRTTKRYWRRRTEPTGAWWPWGLLPLLGLFLLYLYGALKTAPAIEKDVSSQVSSQLSDIGVKVLESNPSGQALDVFANSTKHNKELLESIAQGTQCNTWAGKLTCPTDVNVNLDTPKELIPVTVNPVTIEPESTATYHNFSFARNNQSITLSGEVPSQTIKDTINQAAKAKFSQVIDNLIISKKQATDQYPLAYAKSIEVLSQLRSGSAKWSEGVFTVTGLVDAENERLAQDQFTQSPAPKLGELNLNVVKSVNTCNSEFQSLLSESTINFRTNSAEINPNSQDLLSKLATLAKKCPGNLQVEGHTDSMGSDSYNQTLSQNRAEAVRASLSQLQVESQRVKAIGYGESQPIADNSTATGRAQNRRIVIKIAP